MAWPAVAIADVADVAGGGTPRRSEPCFWGGSIPWLTPGELPPLGTGPAEVESTASTLTRDGLSASSARLLPPGTVMFSSRATIGKVGIAAVPMATNQGFVNLIPKPTMNERYLAWTLATRAPEIARLSGATTFKEVTRRSVGRFRIALPPLDEQRRIVDLLDQADHLRRLRVEADAKAARILPALFIKMFGDPVTNPHDWPVASLGELLLRIDGGWSPMCVDRRAMDGEWGVLKLGAVTWGRYDETQHKALPEGVSPRPGIEVRPGDLLLVRKNTRHLVGACAFVPTTRERLMLSDLIFRLVVAPDAPVLPEYLWALLMSPNKRQEIKALAGGSAGSMPNISKQRLRRASILVPPLELQLSFARAFQAECALRAESQLASMSLSKLLAAVSERAFLGKQLPAASHSRVKERRLR